MQEGKSEKGYDRSWGRKTKTRISTGGYSNRCRICWPESTLGQLWSYVSSVVRSLLIALRSLTSFAFRKVTRTSITDLLRRDRSRARWEQMAGSRWTSGCPWPTDRQRQIENGQGEAFCIRGIEKRCTRGASENSFSRVPPPFFRWSLSEKMCLRHLLLCLLGVIVIVNGESLIYPFVVRVLASSSSSSKNPWSEQKNGKCSIRNRVVRLEA